MFVKVTFAMALIGALPLVTAALLVIAQLLGAITAAGVVSAVFPDVPHCHAHLLHFHAGGRKTSVYLSSAHRYRSSSLHC